MTYTGHIINAAVLILCGLFVIVLGLGNYDSIAAKPIVDSKPSVISEPIVVSNPFIEQMADNGSNSAGPAPTNQEPSGLEIKGSTQESKQPLKIIPFESPSTKLSAQLEKTGPQEEKAAGVSEQAPKIVPLEVPPPPVGVSTRPGLTPRGYTSRYFYIERPKVGLGLSYEIEEVQRQASGNETKDTSNEFREWLPLETSGWAYHPALFKFTLDFVPEWAQTKRDLDPGGSGSDNVFVPSYALDAIFLEPKPYTLHAFATRRELKLRSAFSEPTNTTLDTYGADLRLKYYKVLPTFFKYTHTDTDQSGFFDSTGARDDFNLLSQHTTKNSTSTLNSLYSDDERTSGGNTARVKTFDGNLGNEYYIAGDRRKTLFSTLRYRWTDTESQEDMDYSLTEDLFWRYTDKLYTNYVFSYGKREADAFDSERADFRARLQHLLYENLTTRISTGANLNDFTGGKENTYDNKIDLLYQRNIPWGILSLTSGWNYRYTTREGGETLIPVIDEPQALTTGEVTLLDNENVDLDSIVVTDITGTIAYIENVDYRIERNNSFVSISRTTVGAIANGQTVLVDYRFLRDPAFDDAVFNQAYNIQFYLLNALTLSYGYQHADQNIVSGTPPENTIDDTTQTAEIRLNLGWTDTRLSYEDRDRNSETSTLRWLASQTFRIRPVRSFSFDITGSYGKTKFTDVGEIQEQYGGSSRLVWTPAGWCRFRVEGFVNKITGDVADRIDTNLFAGLELSYRIWRGNVGYYLDSSGSSDTKRNRQALKVEFIRFLW